MGMGFIERKLCKGRNEQELRARSDCIRISKPEGTVLAPHYYCLPYDVARRRRTYLATALGEDWACKSVHTNHH